MLEHVEASHHNQAIGGLEMAGSILGRLPITTDPTNDQRLPFTSALKGGAA